MGFVNSCKNCNKKGIFLKLTDSLCELCHSNLELLKKDHDELLDKISNNYFDMETSILKFKSILKKLQEYENNSIDTKINIVQEFNMISENENALILINKIQNEFNFINDKDSSSYIIEGSINIIKNEYLPLFKKFELSGLDFTNVSYDELVCFLDKAEIKLEKRKKIEAKALKDKFNYIAFDIETTGLNPLSDEIIEIAALKINDGKIIDKFHSLVKPNKKIPKKIIELTNINNEMVQSADPIDIILPNFIDFTSKLPLVAHNVEFDYSFIENNYNKLFNKNFKRKKVCTMKLYKKKYKEWYDESPCSTKLSWCVDELLDEEDIQYYEKNAHRALTDATMVYKIYEKLK